MKTRSPIEVTTRYATTVETLQDAFAFVMGQLDATGETPRITITPVASYCIHDMVDGLEGHEHEPDRFFEVVVSSMVERDSTEEQA